MTLKQLIEEKNELVKEYRSLIDTADVEKRGLDEAESVKEQELAAKIADIKQKITDEEVRAAKEADEIEETRSMEEKQMDKTQSHETEVRAIEQFIRKQEGEELRAVTTGAAPGSLTIPTSISNLIVKKLNENAPLFSRTRNFTPVNGYLEVLREKLFGSAGFVGEMENLNTSDFTMDKVRLDQKRVGTAIELSQHLINDSGINVVDYAMGVLAKRLALTIDNSILNGNKTAQFEGIISDPSTVIDIVETAVEGAIAIDDILDLYNAMHPEYQKDAVFIVGRDTFNQLTKLKDANGHYHLVRDVAETGVTYKLFGLPVIINNSMPVFGAGVKAIALANFQEGYATMTKKGLNLQHISGDTTQAMRGSHLLLLDGYMDGKILNPDAFKVLKVKGTPAV